MRKLRIKTTTIAKIYTNLFSPFTGALGCTVLLYIKFVPKTLTGFASWFGLTLGIFLLALTIFVIFMKLGLINNWDVSDRKQRPKIFLILCVLLGITVLSARHVLKVEEAANFIEYSFVAFFVAFLITLKWKISMHTYAVTMYVCFLNALYPNTWSLLAFLIPIGTAWTRIKLKKHSPSEAIFGIVVSIGVFILWAIWNIDVSSLTEISRGHISYFR